MSLFKKIIEIVSFVFIIAVFPAQESSLHFNQINYDDDFSPSVISAMAQSKTGFVWIGTDNGLFRYDGYTFKKFSRDRKTQGHLSNNHINALLEDQDGNLWIGTSHGLNLYNKNTNDFTPIGISNVKGGSNYVSSLVLDGDRNLWVGTFGGIKKIKKSAKNLENLDRRSELSKSRVLTLFYDADYGIFAGTSAGLRCFDPKTGKQKQLPRSLSANSELKNAKVKKIVKTRKGDLWFGTETSGAFWLSDNGQRLLQFRHDPADPSSISSNWVDDVVQLDGHTIWLATKGGLSIFNTSKSTFTRIKHNPDNLYSLSDNNLKCFMKDRTGSVWIGTSAGAINIYNPSNLNVTRISEGTKSGSGLSNASASSVLRENNHSIWVGTSGGGLNFLDLSRSISGSYAIDGAYEKNIKNIITCLARRDDRTLLCGTYNGLFEFDTASKQFTQIPLGAAYSGSPERPITAIMVDDKTIWVGTDGNGLIEILPNGELIHYNSGSAPGSLSDNFVMALENRSGGIWITTQNGLNFLDKKRGEITRIYKASNAKPLDNNSLTVMFTDSRKRLWIGADYDGLYYLNELNQKFLVLNKEKGFTDAAVKSIAEDAEGNLWVGAEDFLFKIKIKNNGRNLKDSDFEISRFSGTDGIAVKQFLYNSATTLNASALVFGTSKGLLIFDPKKLVKPSGNPPIILTKLIVNNEVVEAGQDNEILKKPISETSQITIDYGKGYIGLEFSSLNFINPQKSKYAYKLESSNDKDQWHYIGTQNRINLSNLDAGSYTLSIKSTNGYDNGNSNIRTLEIIVLPPWYRTWWAYLFYFIVFAAANYLVYRFIKYRLKLRREIFMEQVENERKEEILTTQINFFTNISHEIRTPLTLIKGPVEELLSYDNDPKTNAKLKTIKQNSDRLMKLVNELLDLRKAEKGYMKIYCQRQDIVAFSFEIFESFRGLADEKNIDFKFVLNANVIIAYFDKNQMEKVIYNLLSNAFKFTKKNGKIVFSVEKGAPEENAVYIKVKDNGIGIPENNRHSVFDRFFQVDDRGVQNMGSGVGLALSKNIVELHKGEITTPDEPGTWAKTVFQIKLQLGNQHLSENQIVDVSADELQPQKVEPSPVIQPEKVQFPDFPDKTKKTLMVVEDNEDVRRFIASVLELDYNLVEFGNGLEAVNFLDNELPDLVISDIMMPEMDGIELCRIIKTNESTNHIPVLLLTAKASIDNKIEGLSTGADAYITKPFSTQELKLSIANLLSAQDILRKKYSGNFIIDSDLSSISTPEEQFIKKLMRIIEENLENSEFDVNMLVDRIGMSRTILYKKVTALTNQSVANLIKQIRLKKAADIILNTTHPISEVAFMVGFNDRKHFSREFKKVYNVSPSAYKNGAD